MPHSHPHNLPSSLPWEVSCFDMEGFFPLAKCKVNEPALVQLYRDEPGKRRRVYLEFDQVDVDAILQDLHKAGFDMKTLKRPHTPSDSHVGAFNCLITGPAQAILTLLKECSSIFLASIDLPEYTWLTHEVS